MQLRLIRRAALAAACLAPLTAVAAASDAPVSGVWQRHEYTLSYMGFTSIYSCSGLEDKLKQLLIAAGARDDVKVVGSCSNPFNGPSRIASATVTFYTLAPESAVPAAPKKEAAPGRRIGKESPELKPVTAPEPGVGAWKKIEFKAGTPRYLEEGDCELVEQFDRELLPFFTTRNHDSHMGCVPHQVVLGSIAVHFEALAPLPKVEKPLPAPKGQ